MAYVDFGFPLKCPFVLWFSCKKNNQLRVIQARDGTRKHYGPILTIVTGFGDEAANRVPGTLTQSEVRVRDGSTSHLWMGRAPLQHGSRRDESQS